MNMPVPQSQWIPNSKGKAGPLLIPDQSRNWLEIAQILGRVKEREHPIFLYSVPVAIFITRISPLYNAPAQNSRDNVCLCVHMSMSRENMHVHIITVQRIL